MNTSSLFLHIDIMVDHTDFISGTQRVKTAGLIKGKITNQKKKHKLLSSIK